MGPCAVRNGRHPRLAGEQRGLAKVRVHGRARCRRGAARGDGGPRNHRGGVPRHAEVSRRRIQPDPQPLGAASNASTSDDFTVYYTTFAKEDLETVLGWRPTASST